MLRLSGKSNIFTQPDGGNKDNICKMVKCTRDWCELYLFVGEPPAQVKSVNAAAEETSGLLVLVTSALACGLLLLLPLPPAQGQSLLVSIKYLKNLADQVAPLWSQADKGNATNSRREGFSYVTKLALKNQLKSYKSEDGCLY